MRNHRVFIDENDPFYRFALDHLIRRWGHEVASVRRGLQAWRSLMRDDSPRPAHLDGDQGGIDGLGVYRRSRTSLQCNDVVVITLDGRDRGGQTNALSAGPDTALNQLFTPAQLCAWLHATARLARMQERRTASKPGLHHQTQRDRLTGLWNREGILQVLRLEAAKAHRTHKPVGLITLDLDNFRLVNHLFGASAGDDLLQRVAQAMTKALRPYDSVGRCYADAFLAVLPACNLEATTLLAQRIQEHLPRVIGTNPEEIIPLRATLAVASRPIEQGQDEECFLVEARRALSRAKKAGGNRIVAVEPILSVPHTQGKASVPEADQGTKPLLFDEDLEQ